MDLVYMRESLGRWMVSVLLLDQVLGRRLERGEFGEQMCRSQKLDRTILSF